MNKIIRIGTRASALALWQANTLQDLLNAKEIKTELILIKSTGDLDLSQPLYEMGTTGIFTKTLDTALLNNKIDIAIHSMKDVPTLLAKGIQQGAILERGPVFDVLVKKTSDSLENDSTIATGSLRRKAQWLAHNPDNNIVPLRGNIQTRLNKLQESAWGGAIFAEAALVRLETEQKQIEVLDWMIPAPAQGALMVVCKSKDKEIFALLHKFQMRVEMIQNSAISFSICIYNKYDKLEGLLEALASKFKVKVVDGVSLYTIRHFDKPAINFIKNRDAKVLLEQRTLKTAQFVIKDN